MKAKEFAKFKIATHEMIAQLENTLQEQEARVEQPNAEDLRPANAYDIFVGNVVYGFDADDGYSWHIIDEVYAPEDEFKGYCAHDGCRYGLYGALVEK